jgi:GTP-binding protein YchF
MGLNCGIVGLPNVGKSTIFSALTRSEALIANYAFATIDPNIGIVDVPDVRLKKIAEYIPPQKLVPATVEIVDIAGLVKGASQGKGRGNQFLANIRSVDAILHVVRCFENPDIEHVENRVDPLADREIINLELALADLDSVLKRIPKVEKLARAQDKDAKVQLDVLTKLKDHLDAGKPARGLGLSDDEKAAVRDLFLITLKPMIYVANVDEAGLKTEPKYVGDLRKVAADEGADLLTLCGKLEAEISALDTEEDRQMFLEEAGLEESGLDRLVHAAYRVLGLRTYFTAGETEVRAWTFHDGDRAPQAAGVIHTDFEKGFIKAEVYHYDDLMELHSEAEIRTKGKLRIEGKEYVVRDGDVMHFRFNV